MAQGPHRIADRRREIWVSVDTKLPKEPYHCHLYYKGELVGCILLEDESKEKAFKSNTNGGFLSVFRKSFRFQFEFIPEIKSTFGFSKNNPNHDFDVYTHSIKSIEAYNGNDLYIKLKH